MVYVEINSGKEFFDILKGLSNIFPSVVLKFKEDGIYCNMIDLSRTFVIQMQFPKDVFAAYDIEGERDVIIDLDKLVKSKLKVKKSESLGISIDDDNAMIVFDIKSDSGRKKKFKMREIAMDDSLEQMLCDKEISFQGDVFAIVPFEILKEVVDYDVDTEILVIKANKDLITFERKEDGSMLSAEITLENGSPELVNYDYRGGDSDIVSAYRTQLLKSALSILGVSSFVSIEYSNGSPLVMCVDGIIGGSIRIILAPMVLD